MDDVISTHVDPNKGLSQEQYQSMYQQSISDPESFWAEQAGKYISWYKKWDTVLSGDFDHLNVKWFDGAQLNACYNCVDRHLEKCGDKSAIIWEGDEPDVSRTISYNELHDQVCRFANVLKKYNVAKGDRVCIYMPMIPETAIAMLACARIGAVHSVVFGGFSPEALKNRIIDADCKLVITADSGVRGGKTVPLKANTDEAVRDCPNVSHVIVVKYSGDKINWMEDRDLWYQQVMNEVDNDCPCEPMNATDPFFILYTSGSTGKPKGILHTIGGYLVFTSMTFKTIFNYQQGDVYWCTADVGWITGHSYIIYGPLSNGATTLMFMGLPTYPTPARFWQVIDKHNVAIFYTAPTAIRALICQGDHYVQSTKRTSLKILGTVGEPINPEVWRWYYEVVGEQRCPIVDTWWQTETGGILMTPLPYTTPLKPGSACWPFFGVVPGVIDTSGNLVENEARGHLVITQPWPGQLTTVYGDHDRFVSTYFKEHPGYYYTGDNVMRDHDGYYWIIGRADDVINVSGHRLGTAEIESALVAHPQIAEAAVVDFPHPVKGQGIFAFVIPLVDAKLSNNIEDELKAWVANKIGKIARPETIFVSTDLPKTRSGKIMRRILRKIVNDKIDEIGDTTTLANPEIVDTLLSADLKLEK